MVAANSQCTYGVGNTTTQTTQETSATDSANVAKASADSTSHSATSDTQSPSEGDKFLFTKNLGISQLTNVFGAKTVAALKRL